jgi:hypothetical protein
MLTLDHVIRVILQWCWPWKLRHIKHMRTSYRRAGAFTWPPFVLFSDQSQTMVIHRRTPRNVRVSVHIFRSSKWLICSLILQTKSSVVTGYLWGKWPNRRIAQTFLVTSPLHGDILDLPYVNVEDDFFLPRASPPEVFDTLMRVAGYKILVTGYFDKRSFPNPNLQRDFPLIPWKGEIAVLFIGKRKPYVSRAPPRSLLRFAIAL